MRGVRARTVPTTKGTRTVRNHGIPSRPHLQGAPSPLRVRHSAQDLTDGGRLILIWRLWDALDPGSLIDRHTCTVGGFFRQGRDFKAPCPREARCLSEPRHPRNLPLRGRARAKVHSHWLCIAHALGFDLTMMEQGIVVLTRNLARR